jgi:hypothetical protein
MDHLAGMYAAEALEFNLESAPVEPFTEKLSTWLAMEKSILSRRKEVENIMEDNQFLMSICLFPRLGSKNFTGWSIQ